MTSKVSVPDAALAWQIVVVVPESGIFFAPIFNPFPFKLNSTVSVADFRITTLLEPCA